MMDMRKEILYSKRVLGHVRFYKKYFQIKEMAIRGMQFTLQEDAVKKKVLVWLICFVIQQKNGCHDRTVVVCKQRSHR